MIYNNEIPLSLPSIKPELLWVGAKPWSAAWPQPGERQFSDILSSRSRLCPAQSFHHFFWRIAWVQSLAWSCPLCTRWAAIRMNSSVLRIDMSTQNCHLEMAQGILCVSAVSTSVGSKSSDRLVFRLAAIKKLAQSRATLRFATEDPDWCLSKPIRKYQSNWLFAPRQRMKCLWSEAIYENIDSYSVAYFW
jgi:hypothetical protein